MVLQIPEKLEAIHARHDQIRHDDICVECREPFQRRQTICSDLRFEVGIGQHRGHSGALTLVIVNDEDPARNYGKSGH